MDTLHQQNPKMMSLLEKIEYRVARYGVIYVLHIILQNKVYRHVDNWIMSLGNLLFSRLKLSDTIVIESHNDFDMNGGAFYNYLIKHNYNKKYKIVWLLRNKKPENLPENVIGFNIFKPSLRKTYYLYTAKFMTFDHQVLGRLKNGQTVCYLDHGSIGLKAFKGKSILPDALDCILMPSDFLAPILADQYNLPYPNEKIKILGYPMHDTFYDGTKGDLSKITNDSYKKVILWMPTFRKAISFDRNDSTMELPLGVPILENVNACIRLNDFLQEENALLIIKIHPMQDPTTVKIKEMSNIIILDKNAVKQRGIDNYRLMKDVDALISDYSSAAYDFLHADKPIGFTLDDVKDYKLGLIFEKPEEYMPGHIIFNQNDFMAFIDDVVNGKDPYMQERRRISDLFFKYHDRNSSQRLAEFLDL